MQTRTVIRGKNIHVTDAMKEHIHKKFSKLDKYKNNVVEIVVEMMVEKNPRISQNQIVMVNVYANGAVMRAEEASHDMYASVDMVIDKLERQLKKYDQKKIKNKTGKLKTSVAFSEETSFKEREIEREIENEVEQRKAKEDEKYLFY